MKTITTYKIATIASLLIILTSSVKVQAQFDAMFTQYMHNEMFINPAYTGSKDALSITALHRQQWVGVEGRPITTTLTLHSPIWENKMGLGFSMLHEEIGVTKRYMIYLSYAYRIKTSDKGFLSFGLNGGIHIQSDNYKSLQTDVINDPRFSTNVNGEVTPNFGFGVNYNTDKFFAGLSIPRLLDDNIYISDQSVNKKVTFSTKSFHYYLTVGRVFTLSDYLKLKPSLMLKAVMNAPVEFDISVNSIIKDLLWLGVSYRSSADMSAMIGLQLSPKFFISYAYDYPTSSLNHFTTGSHEIVLSALFGYKGKKVVSTRYF
jgi:type IX secretion system PorP/SprF family membrane protein